MKKVTVLLAVAAVAALSLSCGDKSVSIDSGGNATVPPNDGGGGNREYTLSVSASPSGGGTVVRTPAQTIYDHGASVSVTATPASGYTFTRWSGASTSTNNTVTIYMDANKTLTGEFTLIPRYTLTLSASPTGGGTVTRSPVQTDYASGASVTVTATPASGYAFSNWSGASTSTTTPLTVTMNGNKTLTAVFVQVANAVYITLTYWETKETDLLGDRALDPQIYFVVSAYQGSTQVSRNTTADLLYADNVGQSWSGSAKSAAIPFVTSATEVRISAVVIERDPTFNDDISPGYYTYFTMPVSSGNRGSTTLDYGNGKSKVSLNYEFVWR